MGRPPVRHQPAHAASRGGLVNLVLHATGAILRFVLRLITLALALALVAALFVFFMVWLILRLLFGRRANIKVSAHFNSMQGFKDLSQTVIRTGNWPRQAGASPDEQGLLRRQGGEVQDVQARELPPERR